MKLASISVVTVSLLVFFASAGCSTGRQTTHTDGGVSHMDAGRVVVPDTGAPHDTGIVPHDTGVIPRDTGGGPRPDGGACSAPCTSSGSCTTACGAAPTGSVRCCDSSTMRCFISHTATCPAPGHDAGGGGMSY